MYNNLKSLIEIDLDITSFNQTSTIIKEIDNEKVTLWTESHLNKLNTLRELKNSSSITKNLTTSVSPIKNYSKRILTTEEILALENGLDFIFPSLRFDQETFIANIETLFVNLLGYCSDKMDYDECDIEEKIIYNLTPDQLFLANKLRKICDTFRKNAEKSISEYKKENGSNH